MVHRLRETYLRLGFVETCNPIIVEEQDVYRQFGPEASAVLDRVFYLGGLDRPNQGIGREELEGIASITGKEVTADEALALERQVRVLDYNEHAVGEGANAKAVAYVEMRIDEHHTVYGVGMDANIVSASFRAILSGLQRVPQAEAVVA